MKKILSIFAAILLSFSCYAEDINVTPSLTNGAYVEGKLQIGGTSYLNLYIVCEKQVASAFQTDLYLPEGLTVDKDNCKSTLDNYGITVTPHTELGNCTRFIWVDTTPNLFDASTPILVGKIAVKVDESASIGDVKAYCQNLVFSPSAFEDATNHYVNDIALQRAAVIESMGDDYAFEIIPFALTSGQNDMAVMMKNKLDVASYKLTVEYPTGIAAYKSGRSYATPTVINDNLYSKTDADVTALSMATAFNTTTNVATYSVTNTANDTYLPTTSFVKAFTLPINVTATDPGVYNIKVTVSDIVAYDTENDPDFISPISITGGEYMVSAFLGTPTETDPIVYGHYTAEGQAALKAAATNFASVDMSAATVDAEEPAVASDLTDKLIYGPTKTSYNRAVTGWGTVCLPFELTSGNEAQYYTVESATDNSITFKAASTVAANTPAIVKGTVNASVDGYQYASQAGKADPVNGLTLTGTYAKYNLGSGDGYYISNDAFWGDGATVAPFRAYFTGTVGSAKLSIFIQDPTGLHEITDQLSNEDIYNLQGIKLNKAYKGVNIIGGKKVIVK